MSGLLRWSFVAGHGGAQVHYRANLMASGLIDLGHEARVWPASFEAEDHTIRGWDPPTGEYDRQPAQVLVMRLYVPPPAGELFVRARRAGQVVAFDIDDDIWAFPDWNPTLAAVRSDPAQRDLNAACVQVNMACADVVVAATPSLAQVCARVLDTIKEPDVPVAYIRSPVLCSPSAPLISVPPRVGWMGTWAYRGRDLAMIEPALRGALADERGVLRHLGRDRGEPPLPVFLTALDPAGREPPYAVHEHDWADITELPHLIRGVDLGVIPAEPHRFNLSRSGTTGLAFAACGVPYIASPTPEYQHLFDQGVGLVADDLEDWSTLLKDLLADPGLRRELGQRAREAVAELYAPTVAAAQWVQVVEAL